MLFFHKTTCDWMIVGLGNPGAKYERSRHNVGFRALDALADQLGTAVSKSKFQALWGMAETDGRKLLLLKPQTFMNASGLAVQQAAAFYKIPADHILVIFDDISLPVGRLRVRAAGSAGGHNGIKSIISALGTDQFPRVKVGVGAKPHPDYDLADWVLSSFSKQDEAALAPALSHAGEAALAIIADGCEKAASRFNGAEPRL